jgi:hypothetical protein
MYSKHQPAAEAPPSELRDHGPVGGDNHIIGTGVQWHFCLVAIGVIASILGSSFGYISVA